MKCLTPNCENKAYCRGLCPRCYQVAAQTVCRGKGSWEEFERLGLARPATRQNGKSKFRAALEDRRQAQRHENPAPFESRLPVPIDCQQAQQTGLPPIPTYDTIEKKIAAFQAKLDTVVQVLTI